MLPSTLFLRRRGRLWWGRRGLLLRGRVGGWGWWTRNGTGLRLAAGLWLSRLTLILLCLGCLGGELDLPLADHLHQLAACFLILGVVDRRTVIGLSQADERHRKPDRLLLQIDCGDHQLLAVAHAFEHIIREVGLSLASRAVAERIFQRDRFTLVDPDLHAGRDGKRDRGRQAHQKLLLVV